MLHSQGLSNNDILYTKQNSEETRPGNRTTGYLKKQFQDNVETDLSTNWHTQTAIYYKSIITLSYELSS